MTTVLLTGAAGFAGSHIADEIIENTDWNIIGLDCLTYAGRLGNLSHLPAKRFRMIYHNFREPLPASVLAELVGVRYIIHNGAETHVAKSFENPVPFVESNIMGTFNLLEAARILKPVRFLYVSTDEVFGESILMDLFYVFLHIF